MELIVGLLRQGGMQNRKSYSLNESQGRKKEYKGEYLNE